MWVACSEGLRVATSTHSIDGWKRWTKLMRSPSSFLSSFIIYAGTTVTTSWRTSSNSNDRHTLLPTRWRSTSVLPSAICASLTSLAAMHGNVNRETDGQFNSGSRTCCSWLTFVNVRSVCLENFSLDPSHYYAAPGLSWDAMLLHTKVDLELFTDVDMYIMVENGIRGGISMISQMLAWRILKTTIPSSYTAPLCTWIMLHCLQVSQEIQSFQTNVNHLRLKREFRYTKLSYHCKYLSLLIFPILRWVSYCFKCSITIVLPNQTVTQVFFQIITSCIVLAFCFTSSNSKMGPATHLVGLQRFNFAKKVREMNSDSSIHTSSFPFTNVTVINRSMSFRIVFSPLATQKGWKCKVFSIGISKEAERSYSFSRCNR